MQQQHTAYSVSPSVEPVSNQKLHQTRLFKVAFALIALTVLLFAGSAIVSDVFGGNVEPQKSDSVVVNVEPVVTPGPLDPEPKEPSESVLVPDFIKGGRLEPVFRQALSLWSQNWKVVLMVSVVVALLSVIGTGLYVSHQQELEAQRLAQEEEERLQREIEAAAEEERQKELANKKPISTFYSLVVAMYALSLLATIGIVVYIFTVGWVTLFPGNFAVFIISLLLGFFAFQNLIFVLIPAVQWLRNKVITAARASTGAKKWALKALGVLLHLVRIILTLLISPAALISAYFDGVDVGNTFWDHIKFT